MEDSTNHCRWIHYRLGDMVKHKKMRNDPNRFPFGDSKTVREMHYALYPNSLASKYMRQTEDSDNLDILGDLVREYLPALQPERDELVVHLRVGNVIETTHHTVEELLEKERNYPHIDCPQPMFYVKPLSYYEKALYPIDERIKKVTLVAGGNLVSKRTKSKEYVRAIKNLFEKSGFEVKNWSDNPPDDDFVYMCRSRFFLPSGGNFSRLVNAYRKKHSVNED